MKFSLRTEWDREPNRLTQLYDNLRKEGKKIHDLTISNPTECSISYPVKKIFSALSNPQGVHYSPDPHGLLTARQAVKDYYKERAADIDEENIFITASTSEAYSLLFTLLCNPGETILAPRPSYPLFEFLAQLTGVTLKYYPLQYEGGWYMDTETIARSVTTATKAIIMVHPHNPTGMFIKKHEYSQIIEIAGKHRMAVIADEVFLDFALDSPKNVLGTTAGTSDILTFTLSGISKTIGLPQFKLGWIVISGYEPHSREATARLEIMSDTYLSANTPVQIALPDLMKECIEIRQGIHDRVRSNYQYIHQLLYESGQNNNYPCSVLEAEGGWYAIIRVPRTQTAEAWAIELLGRHDIYVYPGHFFDFNDEGFLVVSLLTEEETFRRLVKQIADFISESVR
jgi:aspartate/methionine/tyrosine aminotransferase